MVPEEPSLEQEARVIASEFRRRGVIVEMAFRGNAKRRVELARKSNADFVVYWKPTGNPRWKIGRINGSEQREAELAGLLAGLTGEAIQVHPQDF
jgi:histidyl-tRNA synthetase